MATKTSLEKWILATSNFITLIPTHSIHQMLANLFAVEFCKTVDQSSGKEKESCCLVFMSSTKHEIRHFHIAVVQWQPRNVQKVWCMCKVVVLSIYLPIAFFPSSLLLPSLLLKLPNIMVQLPNRGHIDKVDQLDHRKTTIHSKKVG